MFKVAPGQLNATLSIDLMCNLFGAILPDVANLPVERLDQLHVTLEYWTPASQCYFESIYRHFQYLLVTLVFKLEYDYPFVFSFYGKHLVRVNYRNLIRVHEELGVPLPKATCANLLIPKCTEPNATEPVSALLEDDAVSAATESVSKLPARSNATSVCAVQTVFLKLQKHILYEFNTLNVMKECDINSHHRQQCKKSWATNSGSLKRLVFAPSVLEDLHLA